MINLHLPLLLGGGSSHFVLKTIYSMISMCSFQLGGFTTHHLTWTCNSTSIAMVESWPLEGVFPLGKGDVLSFANSFARIWPSEISLKEYVPSRAMEA